MKLRNKRTGDIWEFDEGFSMRASQETAERAGARGSVLTCFASSLTKLNEEWEDVPEEPKEHYFITEYGEVFSLNEYEGLNNVANVEDYKQIGNYFDTREEAEKAVEKLKAWKRLKDKGFVFKGINENDGTIKTGLSKGVSLNDCEEFYCDMELLFGGEE